MTRGVMHYKIHNVFTPPPPLDEEQGIFANLHFDSSVVAGFAKLKIEDIKGYPTVVELVLLPTELLMSSAGKTDQTLQEQTQSKSDGTIQSIRAGLRVSPTVGTVGVLALSLREGPRDRYAVHIFDIDAATNRITAKVLRPRNVPIYLNRWSLIRTSNEPKTGIDTNPEATPHAIVGTLRSLQLPQDVPISDDVSLVRLTNADLIELQEFRNAWFGLSTSAFPIGDCAVTLRKYNPDASHIVEEVATALQLFKSGHLERGLEFTFEGSKEGASQPTPTGIHWSETSAYRDDSSVLSVSSAEMDNLKYWLYTYLTTPVNGSSVMARVFRRFRRTYYSEDQHERITDAVIGLEMLVLPGKQTGETGYRVSQRVSFMVSNDPAQRLEAARVVTEA